jgi:hypothetical protein
LSLETRKGKNFFFFFFLMAGEAAGRSPEVVAGDGGWWLTAAEGCAGNGTGSNRYEPDWRRVEPDGKRLHE